VRTPERWKVLEPLIDAASDLPRDRWPAFLDQACGTDAGLRVELEDLLLQYDRADTLLDHPAAERFASLFGEVAAPPPELVNGNYRIERKVGQGGMAAVYLAHDLRHDRKVAVKILHPELTAAFRAERFLAEIRTMAQLHHPHILPLHDSGTADGVLFYVMPYVEGETLRQRLDRERRLETGDAARIIREVAAALDSAHRRGVVHRDIKPENILLDDGGALVADFGIALAVSTASASQADQPGWIAGTPRYMSPEQMAGDGAIDGRADVYSLGAVAYEMLAGRPPFVAGRSAAPAPLHALHAEIPPAADAVLARSLAPAPGDRHSTAGELADALQRALTAPETRTRGRRATRWSLTMAIVVAVIAGGFGVARERSTKAGLAAPAGSAGTVPAGTRQTRNLGAYDLYLRGRDQALYRSLAGMGTAIQYFRQAIAADSTYAAAYAELARTYGLVGLLGSLPGLPRKDAVRLALPTASRAVALDSTLSDAWAELGFVRMNTEYDMRSAKAALDRALALDPSSPRVHGYLASLYGWTERFPEALAEARRERELDPLSVSASMGLAGALYSNGRYDEALAELNELRDVDPPLARTLGLTGSIYLSKGMVAEGLEALRKWDPENPRYGHALAVSGQRSAARRMLEKALAVYREGEGGSDGIAMLYEGLGDYDQAFIWLEKAMDEHELTAAIMSPTFARLRADPRFDRIRARLNGAS
jgi:tetratricopeptide (TPR) repeat protein/tRNA A-37 threonylcarbamoyl transferase component Bud32